METRISELDFEFSLRLYKKYQKIELFNVGKTKTLFGTCMKEEGAQNNL